jgi:hypothetical protein
MLVIDDGRAFGFGGGLGSRFGGRHVVNPEASSLSDAAYVLPWPHGAET